MTAPQKRPNDGLLPLIALLTVAGLVLLAWLPIVAVAHAHGQPVPLNPAALAVGLARHSVVWPGRAVLVLYGFELAGAVVVLLAAQRIQRKRAGAVLGPTGRPGTCHGPRRWSG